MTDKHSLPLMDSQFYYNEQHSLQESKKDLPTIKENNLPQETYLDIDNIFSFENGKLKVNLSQLSEIEVITKLDSPLILKFMESIVLKSNKNVMLQSNHTANGEENRYKIWMNPICPANGEAVHPEDIDGYSFIQSMREWNEINSFTYSREQPVKQRIKKPYTSFIKKIRHCGGNCACGCKKR